MKHKKLIATISAALLILVFACCLTACNNDGGTDGNITSGSITVTDEQMEMLKNICLMAIENGGECEIFVNTRFVGINASLTYSGYSFEYISTTPEMAKIYKHLTYNLVDNYEGLLYSEKGITLKQIQEYKSEALTDTETTAIIGVLNDLKDSIERSGIASLFLNENQIPAITKFDAVAILQNGNQNKCIRLISGKDETYITEKEAELKADTIKEKNAGLISDDSNVIRNGNLLIMTHNGNYIPVYSDDETYFENYEQNAGTYIFLGYKTCSLISDSNYTNVALFRCPSEVIIEEEYKGKPVTETYLYGLIYSSSIESIYIPSSVNTFGGSEINLRLKSIEVSPNNAFYKNGSDKRCLLTKDGTSLLLYAWNSGKEFTIPEGVKNIDDWVFYTALTLEKITLPSSLISIGEHAFDSSLNLKSVVIPANVKNIGAGIFERCDLLETIYCEAEEKPIGWDENWNMSDANVVWGYKG